MGGREPEAGDRYVSPADVAAALGVGPSTVKRWVDRGILPARKTAGGHRKILVSDVERVAREGGFPKLDLGRLGATSPAPAEALADPDVLAGPVLAALSRGDGAALTALLLGAYRAGLTIEALADAVIGPAMRRIGHDWAEGRLNVWQEHRGTLLCAAALYEIRAILPPPPDDAPLALGGGPEGDPYLLGSLLAELALTARGWRAIQLGPNTPLASFGDAIERLRPRLFWLSVSHLADPEAFLAGYRPLYREAERLGIAVAVGGQALGAEVRSRMPYTTFGDGLSHLIAFARTLEPPSRRPRRGRPRGT